MHFAEKNGTFTGTKKSKGPDDSESVQSDGVSSSRDGNVDR